MLGSDSIIDKDLRGPAALTLASGAVALSTLTALGEFWSGANADAKIALHHLMSVLFAAFTANATILIASMFLSAVANRYRNVVTAMCAIIFLTSLYLAGGLLDRMMLQDLDQMDVGDSPELPFVLPIYVMQAGTILFLVANALAKRLKKA